MEQKIAQFINKGMQQDYSVSKASNEFAFKNHNIRITTRGENSLLTVTNEKSNKKLPAYKWGDSVVVSYNKLARTYYKMSFGQPRILNKVDIDCEGTRLINEERVEFKETISIYFDGDVYKDFLFEYNIDGFQDDIVKITNIYSIKFWYDDDFEYFDNPQYVPSTALVFRSIEPLKGIVLGYSVTDDNIVLFTKDTNKDYIYTLKVTDESNEETLSVLYSGNLGFSIDHPIETLFSYESENVQKVYWVDGLNRSRVINIKGNIQENNNSQFDFNPIAINPEVEIEKYYSGAGLFSSGTIQYVITYYNNFMQESAPVYISPLYYLSNSDRGASPKETVSCSFKITISKLDNNWDNIRVYSIIRDSLNSTATGSLVSEQPINTKEEDDSIIIIDNGTNQESIDATQFLFNNDDFIPSTLSKKDDQLFFGNIKNSSISSIDEDLENRIKKSCTLFWTYKTLDFVKDNKNLYDYNSQLKKSESEIKGFKFRETYRFALQFQNDRGIWGEPIWIGDYKNISSPPTLNKIPCVRLSIDYSDVKNYIKDNNIVNVRLLRAALTDADRTIVAQGIVSPTVYNLSEKLNGYCHNVNSWVQRFTQSDAHLRNVNVKNNKKGSYFNKEVPIETINDIIPYDLKEGLYSNEIGEDTTVDNKASYARVLKIYKKFKYSYYSDTTDTNLNPFHYYGFGTLLDSDTINIEILNKNYQPIDIISVSTTLFASHEITGSDRPPKNKTWFKTKLERVYNKQNLLFQTFSVTQSLIDDLLSVVSNKYSDIKSFTNFKEGDLLFAERSIPLSFDNLYTAIISAADGGTNIIESYNKEDEYNTVIVTIDNRDPSSYTSVIDKSDKKNQYFVDASVISFYTPDISKIQSENLNFRIVGYAKLNNNISSCSIEVDPATKKGNISNFGYNDFNTKQYLYSHYLWYSSNIGMKDSEDTDYGYPWIGMWQPSGSLTNKKGQDILKHKIIGNLWYCDDSYLEEKWVGNGISNIKIFNNTPLSFNNKIYKGNYDTILLPYNENGFSFYYINKSVNSIDTIEEESPEAIDSYAYNDCSIKYNSTPHAVFRLNKTNDGRVVVLPGYSDTTNTSKYKKPVTYTGEVFNITNTADAVSDKCYIYPFLYKHLNPNSLPLSQIDPPYIINLSIKEGQYDTNITVPAIEGAFVIVGIYTDLSVSNYICGDDLKCSIEEENLYTNYIKFTSRNNIIPYPKNAYDISFQKVLEVLYSSTKYALYKVISIEDDILKCQLYPSNLPLYDAESFVNVHNNKSFIPVGGLIPGFSDVTWFFTNNGKIGSHTIFNDSNLAFPCCVDTAYAQDIFSTEDTDKILNNFLLQDKYVLLGEFYRNLPNQYGGTSAQALANTKYIVCSDVYAINEDTSPYITITSSTGDTYYQRWDCLRTYPTTEEDVNSVVDIVSVMIESYTNLDGRYDSNRGRLDVHNSRPTNMNLINNAYSQENNFFTVYDLDNRLKNSNLENCYTWSLKKKNNELIDNWTKGLMVNINAVDGAKGKITKLKLWKDYLLFFQEMGIGRIHYNNQTTMSSLEGIPIEIANSAKVSGHTYLSENVGCQNKWTIANSEAGIYFVDGVSKSINLFNGNVNNLTYNKAFKDWAKENLNDKSWKPNESIAYYGVYDRVNHDYYLTNEENCLCFSEDLDSFTSFYDYTKSPMMVSFKDKLIGVQKKNNNTYLWEQFAGDDYCNFYDEYKPYSVEFNVNTEPLADKIFSTVEYRANIKDMPKETFDNLIVDNEYQHGELNNINSISKYKYPNSEKKFRIWRLDIPRDSTYKLDRIRNPWMKLKLEKNTNTSKLMEMHDLVVRYFS